MTFWQSLKLRPFLTLLSVLLLLFCMHAYFAYSLDVITFEQLVGKPIAGQVQEPAPFVHHERPSVLLSNDAYLEERKRVLAEIVSARQRNDVIVIINCAVAVVSLIVALYRFFSGN